MTIILVSSLHSVNREKLCALLIGVFPTHEIEDVLACFELLPTNHGLRTPNEGINQRNLKIWTDVADKICFGRT